MTKGDCHDVFCHIPAHPPCVQHDGMPCEPCNLLTELEAQMQDLYERHSRVSIRRNCVHSPLIHRFPPEISSYIFTLAFPPQDACFCCVKASCSFFPPPNPCKAPSSLILAKVCHTWRALALSTSVLWRNIYVDAEKPNLPLLDHQIVHSGMIPLSIHLIAKSELMQDVAGAEQAVSMVIKELHRTASFYLDIRGDFITLFDSLSELHRPKAAPLLNELHAHFELSSRTRSRLLRLAIEPPRPQHVVLDTIPVNNLVIDWTNLSSLSLDKVDGFLHEILASRHLKRLHLSFIEHPEPTHIVNRSIEDLSLTDQAFTLQGSSFPSLQKLDINFEDMRKACALLSDFLRRSPCPLKDLTLSSRDQFGARVMRALMGVLETTTTLQRLTLEPVESERTRQFDSFIRRLSSRDRNFLPCLQRFVLRIYFDPPFDLLVDMMEPNEHPSEIISPLHELILELPRRLHSIIIPQDDHYGSFDCERLER